MLVHMYVYTNMYSNCLFPPFWTSFVGNHTSVSLHILHISPMEYVSVCVLTEGYEHTLDFTHSHTYLLKIYTSLSIVRPTFCAYLGIYHSMLKYCIFSVCIHFLLCSDGMKKYSLRYCEIVLAY